MGIRLVSDLATVSMFRLKASRIRIFPSVHLYCQYVDDIFICADTEKTSASLLNKINSAHQNIKLTRDNVNGEDWLLF